MIEQIVARLIDREDLTEQEARETMAAIMSGECTDAQIGGFLVALRMKGETIPEITGCAQAMREAATRIDVGDLDVVDTCGTGGTKKGTLNISTAAALVTARGRRPGIHDLCPPIRYNLVETGLGRRAARAPGRNGGPACPSTTVARFRRWPSAR